MTKLKHTLKTYPKCATCNIFQMTKQLSNRALICETARATGTCPKDKWAEGAKAELRDPNNITYTRLYKGELWIKVKDVLG